jgi:hypothetical protein
MKRILFFILLVSSVYAAKADQLAWLTKDQAAETVDYLKNNDIKEVILFCGCCDKDVKKKVKVTKIFYRQTENPDYFEVVIVGNTLESEMVNEGVDLAYTFINKDGKAACLGKEMGYQCDPCTKPFKWK